MAEKGMSQEDIATEVSRRQVEEKKRWIIDQKKDRQRQLASSTNGKRVHDIIEFKDDGGDDIIVWIFRELKGSNQDLREGEKVVGMVIFIEQTKSVPLFEDLTFRQGRYFTPNGENFILELRSCSYSY